CRGGGLSREREERPGCNSAESSGNKPLERAAQGVARKTFQTFGEVVDAEKEQADPTQELYHDGSVHWHVWTSPRKVDTGLRLVRVAEPLELLGGQEAQGGVPAGSVVERLDVLE